MKNKTQNLNHHELKFNPIPRRNAFLNLTLEKRIEQPLGVLFLTSYPPRECGIATYTQDLIVALQAKFKKSFHLMVAALEISSVKHDYDNTVTYVLETDQSHSYQKLANDICQNQAINCVVIQHEFGLFSSHEADFLDFVAAINKPIIIGFHTVLPQPDVAMKQMIQTLDASVASFILMTQSAAQLLVSDYQIEASKITVIPHGTHLVEHTAPVFLKQKYNVEGRKVISTFGLLSSGKCLETTLKALPSIIENEPDVLFLILGKTHPTVIKNEGEAYRERLKNIILENQLEHHVQFINHYLPLDQLLEYLQLTDVYLFTSKDRNQAVSGTFSYAISCGCPIISTPIPHAVEVLENGTGLIVDFEDEVQLAHQVIRLLKDETLRHQISLNGIHKLAPTAWENSAIAHAQLFQKSSSNPHELKYTMPEINLRHFKHLTTDFGMIQFAVINQPDLESGYTLDDNARALVAICQHYALTLEVADLKYIELYYEFIAYCWQVEGYFLNYVDTQKSFTSQNLENLDDANGRAIWALGYLLSIEPLLPVGLTQKARTTLELALPHLDRIHSPRAMAFIIKGLCLSQPSSKKKTYTRLIVCLASRLVQMYRHESKFNWNWFESYLTYGNSILPEAMLYAYLATNDKDYKEVAFTTFDFLLSKIFIKNQIHVISNRGWMYRDSTMQERHSGGEQPIDVAYTIIALSSFYQVLQEPRYLQKIKTGFSWFLGNNHLEKIIYNPATGGCYDGLELDYINLNQGAESTVSYLMARLTLAISKRQKQHSKKRTHRYLPAVVRPESILI